jgi:hypothetical protein
VGGKGVGKNKTHLKNNSQELAGKIMRYARDIERRTTNLPLKSSLELVSDKGINLLRKEVDPAALPD